MLWDKDFELQRLRLLLIERLVVACTGQPLAAEAVADFKKEMYWEADKVRVEIMKVMCRPYADAQLRQYLQVHLEGVDALLEKVGLMRVQVSEGCLQLLEAFRLVLMGISDCLVSWQERRFGDGESVLQPKGLGLKASGGMRRGV